MEYMCFNMYENTYISAQNQTIVHLWSHPRHTTNNFFHAAVISQVGGTYCHSNPYAKWYSS